MKTEKVVFALVVVLGMAVSGGWAQPGPQLRPFPPPPRPGPRPPPPPKPQIQPQPQDQEQTGQSSSAQVAAEVESLPLFRQARQAKRDRYEFCVKKGARFVLTPDKKSFFVVWYPPSDPGAPRPPVIATLHGHASYAFDEFFLWYDEAVKRGYGIVALQWWFGRGEAPNDYYLPPELNRTFDQLFKAEGILTGRNLLHGFSRGAANSYGVTLFDRVSKGNYFLLTVANSGKAESDFSPYTEVNEGKFGPQPFQGTHWVLYAGGRAPHPEKTGIQGMRETEAWLKKFGGTIDLFIEDPNGDHGGFHRNPKNISTALDVFGKLLHP